MRRILLPLLILATPALADAPTQFAPGFCYERSYATNEIGAGAAQRVIELRFEDDASAPDDARMIRARFVASTGSSERSIERPAVCEVGRRDRLACQIVGQAGGFIAAPEGSNVIVTVGGDGAILPEAGADRRFVMTPCR